MKIAIDKLEPGMILKENVYNKNSSIPLILSGDMLTEFSIMKIKITGKKIVDVVAEKEIEETISEIVKNDMKVAVSNFDYFKISELSRQIVTKILNSQIIKIDFSSYLSIDISSFEHVINACIMSIYISSIYNKNEEYATNYIDLDYMAIASLIKDIGKKCEDPKVLESIYPPKINKEIFVGFSNDYYTSYHEKAYNLYTYSMLQDEYDIPTIIKNSILYLNEREDGKGLLKVSESIMKDKNRKEVMMAKIMQVAIFYEYITDHIIRNKMSINNIPVILKQAVLKLGYSEEIVNFFIKFLPVVCPGTRVKLSTGEIGYVEAIRLEDMYKPKIRIEDTNEIIDLYFNSNIIITEVLGPKFVNELKKHEQKSNSI